jgi:hypothetical protein
MHHQQEFEFCSILIIPPAAELAAEVFETFEAIPEIAWFGCCLAPLCPIQQHDIMSSTVITLAMCDIMIVGVKTMMLLKRVRQK